MVGSEDDMKGKIYDKELYRKLLRYLKPYWKLVAVSFILLLLFAAAELAVPYVTKVAVDQIVSPNTNLISFNSEAGREKFLKENADIKFENYSYDGSYFLSFSNDKLYYLAESIVEELNEQDRFFKKVVFLKNNKTVLDKIEGINFLTISAELIAVGRFRAIHRLPENILARWNIRQPQLKPVKQSPGICLISNTFPRGRQRALFFIHCWKGSILKPLWEISVNNGSGNACREEDTNLNGNRQSRQCSRMS